MTRRNAAQRIATEFRQIISYVSFHEESKQRNYDGVFFVLSEDKNFFQHVKRFYIYKLIHYQAKKYAIYRKLCLTAFEIIIFLKLDDRVFKHACRIIKLIMPQNAKN